MGASPVLATGLQVPLPYQVLGRPSHEKGKHRHLGPQESTRGCHKLSASLRDSHFFSSVVATPHIEDYVYQESGGSSDAAVKLLLLSRSVPRHTILYSRFWYVAFVSFFSECFQISLVRSSLTHWLYQECFKVSVYLFPVFPQ